MSCRNSVTQPPEGAHAPAYASAQRQAAVRWKTLQVRLSIISIVLFVLIVGFGLLTIHLFNGFNQLSDDLRENWLPTTRVLGDLNNDTSDFRTAEGDILLASSPSERAAHEASADALTHAIDRSEREYAQIPRTGPDTLLFTAFLGRWSTYRRLATEVMSLASSGHQTDAAVLYRGASRAAYNAASDALGALTAHNVAQAQQASSKTARAYDQGRWLIIFALLVAGTLLAVSLTLIRRLISTPLTDLAHTMRLLAANTTDLDIAGLTRDDEIGEMARAVDVFRANAIALIESEQRLARQAAMLEQQLAYEQKLMRQQRDFVSMISHEFRTPLTAIDAHAQRLRNMRDHITPEALAERATRIRASVLRITGLMDNLLNSSRLMDGDVQLLFQPKPLDLRTLLAEVCAFARETSPSATLEEDFGDTPLPLAGDAKLLFQMFGNLLANAIKYSTSTIFVRITARRTQAQTVVTIADQGIGIPASDLENLFTRYYRGQNVSGMVGTGVGLYLAKTVVELHGGTINVNSEEGAGACFTVSLANGSKEELLY
jgi:signal transduction histidine kinase